MKVVVTHWIHPEASDVLRKFASVSMPSGRDEVWSKQRTIDEAAHADALITCMADIVDWDLLNACPNLRIVAATLKGYDNYDVDACTAHRVWLTNVPDIIIPPTAELAISLSLGIMRNIRQRHEHVRTGMFNGWRPQYYGNTLSRSVVGIIGMGKLGREIARLLYPFDIRQGLYTDIELCKSLEHWQNVGLEQLLRRADLVIVCLPLTPSTRHTINRDALSQLRKGGYIVNIGRGSVVDEGAILAALQSGHLSGYAADVFEFEDWALATRPSQISSELRQHKNTLFTPHLGSNPDSVRRAMSLSAVRQVQELVEGKVPSFAINKLSKEART